MMKQVNILLMGNNDNEGIVDLLQAEGYAVKTAVSYQQAQHLLDQHDISLILVLLSPNKTRDVTLCQQLRLHPDLITTPILCYLLQADPSLVRDLRQVGVDGCLSAPISNADVLATVKGWLIRAKQWQQIVTRPEQPLPYSISLDLQARTASFAGRPLLLTTTEFDVLACLAQKNNQVVPLVVLREAAGRQSADEGSQRIVRFVIRNLRSKLAPNRHAVHKPSVRIENVRGVGYRLIIPQSESLVIQTISA